jgi:tRNA(adenine34) deaminase
MELALSEAERGARAGEVPVGAVLLDSGGDVLVRAHNSPVSTSDATAHAEMSCLRRAGEAIGNYRLTGTILVVTLEPCLMCVGALIHSRVAGLIFGARDPKSGAAVSRLGLTDLDFVNHVFWAGEGVLATECSSLLTEFFRSRRGGD